MPIYVYNCKKCKKEFEVMGKMSDLNKEGYKPECPDCKSKDNEKVIVPSSFVLNGSGWYKDGYGRSK